MVTSGTREHLDFLSHLQNSDDPDDEIGDPLSFDKINETKHEQFTQIKVNLQGVCPSKKSTGIKVCAIKPLVSVRF